MSSINNTDRDTKLAEVTVLVRKWSGCLEYQKSLEIVQEIAKCLSLPTPYNQEEYHYVLRIINENYPEAYREICKEARAYWGIYW